MSLLIGGRSEELCFNHDLANVLGGLVISSIANAAYIRPSLPQNERRPFFLYVDEFHNFTFGAVADMLSELRKYGWE